MKNEKKQRPLKTQRVKTQKNKIPKEKKYMKNQDIIRICIIGVLLLVLLGVIPFVRFTRNIETFAEEQCGERLGDYADNNAYAAQQELERISNLIVVSTNEFEALDTLSEEEIQYLLRTVWTETDFNEIRVSDTEGNCINNQGETMNIKNCSYFKRSLIGEAVVVSGEGELPEDDGMLVFSAPIIVKGKVIGTLHGTYDLFELSQMTEIHSFDGASYSLLIDGKGKVILNSMNQENMNEGEDYFDFLSKVTMKSGSLEEMQDSMKHRQSGSFTYKYQGETRVGYYTPLESNNWYLVKLVTGEQALSMYKPVDKMVIGLTISMMVLCILSALFIFWAITIINRHKKMQLQMALSQAQQASSAKSQFLSRMSHEIRTPMNAILGLTGIAGEHINEPEKVASYLRKIDASSKVLLGIINDVLDMNAIENDKIKLSKEKVELKKIMDTIAEIYEPQCQQKGINFQIDMKDIEDKKYVGDPLRLQQIILNLVSNAYKFTEADGTIKVTLNESTRKEDTAWIHLTVADTGMGMTPEMHERLFKPFEQENATTAQKYGGSGLGLSICKSLLDLMQGTIAVESEKEKGTIFSVQIPLGIGTAKAATKVDEDNNEEFPEAEPQSTEPQSTEPQNTKPKYDFSGRKILLAEDNELNKEIATELLEMVGAKVEHAENGQKAIEMFEASALGYYDLILMDIQMPVLGGYEATAAIRKLNRMDAGEIPIFAMTANAFAEDVSKALAAGMNGHIAKPINTNQLYATLWKEFS